MNIGEIVYFLSNDNVIEVGIVEQYINEEDRYYVHTLVLKSTLKIDNVPICEMTFPTKHRKLPKNFTYDCSLYSVEHENLDLSQYHINIKEDVIKAYNDGVLVFADDYRATKKVEDNVHDNEWWLIARQTKPSYVRLSDNEMFSTFAQAHDEKERILKEQEKINSLTDYEYSIMELDNILKRWNNYYQAPKEECQRIKDRFLRLANIEDIMLRIHDRCIQWKYFKNDTWKSLSDCTEDG